MVRKNNYKSGTNNKNNQLKYEYSAIFTVPHYSLLTIIYIFINENAVVTRKSGADENSLGNQCGLLIIDEVHLLADDRGAVIESVVARLHRLVESRQRQLRIVGLSATLPNYRDVAEFLQVPERGLFYFGPEHRPVPLQQTFVGVTGNIKDRFLMENKMNDVCYDIVKDSLARGYQVMVFVHSRKGTGDTATALASRATAAGELDRYFVTQGKDGGPGDAYKRYTDRIKKSRNREVSNHFYNGMGIREYCLHYNALRVLCAENIIIFCHLLSQINK
jgi:activating signal cointegrator complex subunit 3